MSQRRIYDTKARTDPSIILRSYDVEYKNNTFERGYGRIIAGAETFTREESREVTQRKSLGKRGMRPFQVVPQSVDVSLTLNRIAFYRQEALKEIGDIDSGLIHQTKPLIIQENQETPRANVDLYEYHDCWFTSNPIKFDISSSNIIIKQKLKIECAYMVPLGVRFSGFKGIDEAQELLDDPIFL